MTPFALGIMAGLTFMQASIAAPRQDFSNCLNRAALQAASQQIAPDQFNAFASQQCSAQGASFKAALVAFDVKNGVKRAQAAADAQLQIEDYLAVSLEKYAAKSTVKSRPSAPVQPVQAAAPAPPKDN